MRAFRPLSLLVLAIACSDGTSSNDFPASGVSPASQWSGGTVTAHSAGFSGAALPTLYAAGTALTVTRVNDTTLSLRLPVAPSGELVISRSAAGHDTIGLVQLVGLDRSRSVPGMMGYEPLVPEGAGGVHFVGQGVWNTTPHALAILDPATDQVSYVTGLDPVQSSYGIQPTFILNRFVLRDSTGLLGVWQLFPTPLFLDTAVVQSTAARHLTQINDTTWLTNFSNLMQVTTPAGTQFANTGQINDPLRVVYSPDGSRIALTFAGVGNFSTPVLDAATGDSAYTVHAYAPTGVAFSPLADRLYVTSAIHSANDSLIAVRASDGLRLGVVPLPPGYKGFGLAADAKVDRLYQIAESSGTKAVLVYDGATLSLIGQLTCPGSCGNSYSWSAGIGVDTLTNKIHVVFPDTPIPVITYDRLP